MWSGRRATASGTWSQSTSTRGLNQLMTSWVEPHKLITIEWIILNIMKLHMFFAPRLLYRLAKDLKEQAGLSIFRCLDPGLLCPKSRELPWFWQTCTSHLSWGRIAQGCQTSSLAWASNYRILALLAWSVAISPLSWSRHQSRGLGRRQIQSTRLLRLCRQPDCHSCHEDAQAIWIGSQS